MKILESSEIVQANEKWGRKNEKSDNEKTIARKKLHVKVVKIYRISCFILKWKMLNFFLMTKPVLLIQAFNIILNMILLHLLFLQIPWFFFSFFVPEFSLAGTHFHWPRFIRLNYFTRNTFVSSSNWKVMRVKTVTWRRRSLLSTKLFVQFSTAFVWWHAFHIVPSSNNQKLFENHLKWGHNFKTETLETIRWRAFDAIASK